MIEKISEVLIGIVSSQNWGFSYYSTGIILTGMVAVVAKSRIFLATALEILL